MDVKAQNGQFVSTSQGLQHETIRDEAELESAGARVLASLGYKSEERAKPVVRDTSDDTMVPGATFVSKFSNAGKSQHGDVKALQAKVEALVGKVVTDKAAAVKLTSDIMGEVKKTMGIEGHGGPQ